MITIIIQAGNSESSVQPIYSKLIYNMQTGNYESSVQHMYSKLICNIQ